MVTGSARGIGAETVKILNASGAIVVHGDWDSAGGENVDAQIFASGSLAPIQFVKTDVTDYESLLRLFETAWEKFGRVDIAISNAGLQEAGNWFDPGLDLESVKAVSQLLHWCVVGGLTGSRNLRRKHWMLIYLAHFTSPALRLFT